MFFAGKQEKKRSAENRPLVSRVPEANLAASEADSSDSEVDVAGAVADAAASPADVAGFTTDAATATADAAGAMADAAGAAADAAGATADAAGATADAATATADAARAMADAAGAVADAAGAAADVAAATADAAGASADDGGATTDAASSAADAVEATADAAAATAEVAASEHIPINSRVLKHGTKTISFGLYWEIRKTFEELMTAVGINPTDYGATTQPCSFDSQWMEALLAAAEAGADFTKWNDSGDTPVHYIVDYLLDNKKSLELFGKILEIIKNGTVVNCENNEGHTPLYRAIINNNLKAVEVLIMRGANIYKVNDEDWSALHRAVFHPVILNYFLEKVYNDDSIRNLYNDRGHNPLHTAVRCGQLQSFQKIIEKYPVLIIEKTTNNENCLHLAVKNKRFEIAAEIFKRRESLKVDHGICIDSFPRDDDNSGKNPFRAALQGKNKEFVELFLQNGAVLSNKGNEEKTALEIIATKFSNVSDLFKNVFDHFITTPSDANKIEYSPLTNSQDMSQIKVIQELILHGHKDLLLHPLIHSLVYIKWNHFLHLFYAMIAVQATLLILLTIFVATVFNYRDTGNTKDLNMYLESWNFNLLVVLIYTTVTILMMQELLLIDFKRLHYVYDPENWMRLGFLVLALILPVVLVCMKPETWQRHAACAAVLLGWLQAMFLFSRFPSSGNSIIMYERVAVNFIKSFASTIFLVVAFALCFMIQFHSKAPFDIPITAFLKTLVMMSSELDYANLFGEDHEMDLHDTVHLVRLLVGLFVVFIGTALVNFLVSVSVNDINELTAQAETGRLEKQVQLLAAIEAFLYDGPFANVFRKLIQGQRYYMQITYSAVNAKEWRVLYGVFNVKNDEFITQILRVRPNAKVHVGIVDVGKRNRLREEPNQKKPKSGEEKENKEWVVEVISKLDEEINSLANELRQVSRSNEDLKDIIRGVDVKMVQLILNKHCICETMSDSLKQMTLEIKKIARDIERMKIAGVKGVNEDCKKNGNNGDRKKIEKVKIASLMEKIDIARKIMK